MVEFFGPIINAQSPEHLLNKTGQEFAPFAAGLHGSMSTHGASEEEYRKAQVRDTLKPEKLQNDGMTIFLLETEKPLFVSQWAVELAGRNPKMKAKAAAKL